MKQVMLHTRLAVAALAACSAPVTQALAQDFPNRPLRLVVPFAAGGTMDLTARMIGKEMAGVLKQPVVVENREGASGMLGVDHVVKAAPDGYTLCWCQTGTLIVTPLTDSATSFNLFRDLAPVSQALSIENVLLVRKDLPVGNFKELVELGRKTSKGLTFGSPGMGSTHHLGAMWLSQQTGMNLLHVPYKGEGPALAAVMAGQIDMAFTSVALARPLLPDGKVKAVAALGNSRSQSMPEVPTVTEQGFPDYSGGTSFMGINAPAGTPPAVLEKLASAVAQSLKVPEVRTRLSDMALAPVGSTPAEYEAFLKNEVAIWSKLIKATGLTRN